MTTTVTITGSGTPVPSVDRAGPGVLVECGESALQFDAGRNTLARLLEAGVPPAGLSAVFLTHYHSDHLVGLQDLVLTRWVMDRDEDAGPLTLVAPTGATERYCRRMLDAWDDDLSVRSGHNRRSAERLIDLRPFPQPGEPTLVWQADEVRVLAGPVRHEPVVGAVGFRIETPDGAIAITGDTRVCDEVAELADGASVLVYEAMRVDIVNRRRPEHRYIADYHADTVEIGRQAAQLGVPTVMLTHLIPPPSGPADVQTFVDDVRAGGYDGEVMVCRDLDSVELG